jgi:hypothetical protein
MCLLIRDLAENWFRRGHLQVGRWFLGNAIQVGSLKQKTAQPSAGILNSHYQLRLRTDKLSTPKTVL